MSKILLHVDAQSSIKQPGYRRRVFEHGGHHAAALQRPLLGSQVHQLRTVKSGNNLLFLFLKETREKKYVLYIHR